MERDGTIPVPKMVWVFDHWPLSPLAFFCPSSTLKRHEAIDQEPSNKTTRLEAIASRLEAITS